MNGGRIMWSSCCHCRPKTDAFETLSGCSEPKPCPNGNYEVHRNRVLDMRTLHLNSGGATKGFPPQPGRTYSQIHPAVDLAPSAAVTACGLIVTIFKTWVDVRPLWVRSGHVEFGQDSLKCLGYYRFCRAPFYMRANRTVRGGKDRRQPQNQRSCKEFYERRDDPRR